MPVEWRLQVLEERLTEDGCDPLIETAALYELEPEDLTTVLDAIAATGEGFPVVLVDGRAACAGDIDIERIAKAARAAD